MFHNNFALNFLRSSLEISFNFIENLLENLKSMFLNLLKFLEFFFFNLPSAYPKTFQSFPEISTRHSLNLR